MNKKTVKYPTVAVLLTAALTDALKKIVSKLPPESFALAGGLAVVHWADVRETQDIDLAITGVDFKKLPSIFPGGQEKPLIYTVRVADQIVDFLQPKVFPWSEEAIKNAPVINYLGSKVKILSPEYLILYKLAAGREKDQADIESLLRSLPGVPAQAIRLVSRYLPEELEDIEQMVKTLEYM